MSLLVAMPLYQSVSAEFFVNWVRISKHGVVGTVMTHSAMIVPAMEQLVEQALSAPDWDRLVIMEQDMMPPLNVFSRILQYTPQHAVVGSLYFRHQPPHEPYAYISHPEVFGYHPLTPEVINQMVTAQGLYEVQGVGFGLTSIARPVLENWDTTSMFDFQAPWSSHDLWFCHHAIRQGHQVFVDTAVQCGHLTTTAITLADYQRKPEPVDLDAALTLDPSLLPSA